MKISATKKRIIAIVAAVIVLAGVIFGVVIANTSDAALPDAASAAALIRDSAGASFGVGATTVASLYEGDVDVEVTAVEHAGNGCVVTAKITSRDLASAVTAGMDAITALDAEELKSDGMKARINAMLAEWYAAAGEQTTDVEVLLAESNGTWIVHTDLAFADACCGGLATLTDSLDGAEQNSLKRLRTCVEVKYDAGEEPDTRSWFAKTWEKFKSDFRISFIEDNRWLMLIRGLGTTMEITVFAALIGIVLGFLVAVIRVSHDRAGKFGFMNAVCKVYLTVIRGTPVLIQLMIIYFVILAPIRAPKILVAIIAFGINSGAYVAEIVRGGIMSVEIGQTEAGRSLGLNYRQTMISIVLPQAFKAVLPALANEFIVLVKETSISAYIALQDLTRAGDKIRGATYQAFMPLIAVALIYLAVVMVLSMLVGKLERRLRKSDRG